MSEPIDFNDVFQLGHVALKDKDYHEAEKYFLQARQLQPQHIPALMALGETYMRKESYQDAIPFFQEALELSPNTPDIYIALSLAFKYSNHLKQAIECLQSTLKFNHREVEIYYHLGAFCHAFGEVENAVGYYKLALDIQPNHALCWKHLGKALAKLFNYVGAQQCFEQHATMLHGYPLNWPRQHQYTQKESNEPLRITRHKLEHDIEQLSYLIEEELISPLYQQTIHFYESLRDALIKDNKYFRVYLEGQTKQQLLRTYGRQVFCLKNMQFAEPILNPDVDWKGLEQAYLSQEPGLIYFDHFLSEDVLKALRRFCLASTIWHDDNKPGRYLGAYQAVGFNHPIIYIIAKALCDKMPQVFDGLHLAQTWGFKYDSHYAEGIKVHADAAKVNVNFWVTPDEANLDPESGGIVVYKQEAPLEWSFDTYNSDEKAMFDYLEVQQAQKEVVPHRCNRAVMFNSNLLHVTDKIHFKPGYRNRRINVTMLFGYREA